VGHPAFSRSGFQIDIVALDDKFEANSWGAAWLGAAAVGEMKLPSVPVTDQLAIGDASGRQRRAAVGAGVAQGSEDSTGVGDAD
jgi:hypothetical protein